MEKHLGFLERRCRLCGKTFSKAKTVQNCDKTAFRRELLNFFGVDVVVSFLSQVIFVFLLFLGMVMYANEIETKEK